MIDSNPTIVSSDFSEISLGFTDPTCNELPWFLAMGLLTSQEHGMILNEWDRYESSGWFEGELTPELTATLKRILMKQGWGCKGNFFTDIHNLVFPTYPKRLSFREWYSDNMFIDKHNMIWGEEIGFYEFEGFCVAKSVIDNTHLVWDFNSSANKYTPFITGGIELTMTNPQITTKGDIKERFNVELVCETVIYSR